MICNKCKCEMKDGVCPQCQSLLDENSLSVLTEVGNDFDAEVTISLLASCGIAAYKRYSGYSAVAKIYCGNSNLGVKIYVNKSDYNQAKEIIEAPFDESEFNGGEND